MTLREICPFFPFADLDDEKGKLVVIDGGQVISFDIKRVFYIYEEYLQIMKEKE